MVYHGEERRVHESGVRIPRWALGIILAIIGQMLLMAASYGQLIQLAHDTSDRVERIERKVDALGH